MKDTNSSVGSIKLPANFKIDGTIVKVLNYNLDDLQGDAVENATRALTATGYVVQVADLDTQLHASLFAEAAGVTFEDIKRLPMKTYMKTARITRDFLLNDSEESQKENTSEE